MFSEDRTLLRSALGTKEMISRYRKLQDRDSAMFLRLLHQEPEKFIARARRIAGSMILDSSYGWNVKGEDDYLVSLMQKSFELHAESLKPGRWLVDTFPIIRFIPI
ncbi:cytochrome p450 [Moniliophthora roreri MCA 2997]|uniref:Cytochrome p450 n=1 Tax=Moniliophthora roreri (strain MCA 2997) TaxID=1381753 RepID=V2XTC4_MONRO|nr:cytochrome p450 [Moniliophthora roreri MCA 2997]